MTQGRYPIPREITSDEIKGPTLVTLFKLKYPGADVVAKFYRYTFGSADETLKVPSCPGCGKNLGYVRTEHRCPGTLLPNPILNLPKRIELKAKKNYNTVTASQ